jgi:multicomponent Na+:H+ antiporter subunit C
VILFYLVLAYKRDAAPPLLEGAGAAAGAAAVVNPLPHALMLTAIVVGAATTGVGLALIVRVHRVYGTLQEPDLRAKTGLS